jgi:hypothetical protein
LQDSDFVGSIQNQASKILKATGSQIRAIGGNSTSYEQEASKGSGSGNQGGFGAPGKVPHLVIHRVIHRWGGITPMSFTSSEWQARNQRQ